MRNKLPARDIAEDCKGLEVVFDYNGKDRHGIIHEVFKTYMVVDLLSDGLETTPLGESRFKSFRYDRIQGDLEVNTSVPELYENRL